MVPLRRASRAVPVCMVLLGLTAAACGGGGGAPAAGGAAGKTPSSGSAAGSSAGAAPAGVTLAKGASALCKTPPTDSHLMVTLDKADWPDVGSATGLTPVNYNQPGQDGAFTAGTVAGAKAIQVVPGQDSGGSAYTYLELYFTTGGVVTPDSKNVMLCLEYEDDPSGIGLTAQYSGNDAIGPVNGAYNAAPEAYGLTGSKKWLVASFTFSNVNFMGGAAGPGLENGSADFRVNSGQTNPFWVDRAWLVTKNVPAQTPLAQTPAPPAQ